MLLKVESTRTTLPTFTPRIRTGVPTQIPHACENSKTTWYFLNRDRSWIPRSQTIARAKSAAPETMNSPTPPSHTLLHPNPKSPSGCIVCRHSVFGTSRTAARGLFPFADGERLSSELAEAALIRRNLLVAREKFGELPTEGRNDVGGGGSGSDSSELAEAIILRSKNGLDSARRIEGVKP